MLAREVHHLGHLGFGDFVGKHTAFPDTVVMNMQHDAGRFLPVLLEEAFHNVDDKLHGSIVVIQEQHAIEIGPLGDCFCPGNDNRSGVAAVVVTIGAR